MLRRIRELFNDVLRQADLLLLALCGGASLFGVLMVSSATRYMHTNRLVLVQAAALVIGVLLYLLVSQIDVGELVKYWKWIFLWASASSCCWPRRWASTAARATARGWIFPSFR